MSQTTQGQPCTLLDLTGTFEATVLGSLATRPETQEGDIHVDKGARSRVLCMPLPKKGEGWRRAPGAWGAATFWAFLRSHEDGVAAAPFGDKVEL